MEPTQLLLKGTEVAERLGISRALVFRWMQNGTLPTVRVKGSRVVRVPFEALLRWISDRTHFEGSLASTSKDTKNALQKGAGRR